MNKKNREPERIRPFCDKLYDFWIKHPYLRFSQIISYIENTIKHDKDISYIFYVEDDEILKCIEGFDNNEKK